MKGPLLSFLKDIGALNLGKVHLFRVILMLTGRCPLHCRTCGIWKSDSGEEPLLSELETFFKANSLSWLNLTGGEIVLREDLEEIFGIIAATQKRLAFLSFPTSGHLVEKTIRDVEAGLDAGLSRVFVTVSFDGGRATHDELRGTPGVFDSASATFTGLKALAATSRGRLGVIPGMTLSAELMELTEDPVGDICRDLDLDGPHEVHINLAHTSKHYYGNEGIKPLPVESIVNLVGRLYRSRQSRHTPLNLLERLYMKGARDYLSSGTPPLACKACKASVFIDSDWIAYPCTIFPHRLGDMKALDFDLSKLSISPVFRKARKEIEAGNCPGCWTPCEAYTSISGAMLDPSFFRLAFCNGRPRAPDRRENE